MKSPNRVTRKIMKSQYTDEFGGYSKTWFADNVDKLQNMNNEQNSDGTSQAPGSQFEVENGLDCLARSVGINIEQCAIELALDESTQYLKPSEIRNIDKSLVPAHVLKEIEDKPQISKEEQI